MYCQLKYIQFNLLCNQHYKWCPLGTVLTSNQCDARTPRLTMLLMLPPEVVLHYGLEHNSSHVLRCFGYHGYSHFLLFTDADN